MGTRSRTAVVEPEEISAEDEVEVVASAAPIVQAETVSQEIAEETQPEQDLVSFADSSPYETVFDESTGTYRLRMKETAPEDQDETLRSLSAVPERHATNAMQEATSFDSHLNHSHDKASETEQPSVEASSEENGSNDRKSQSTEETQEEEIERNRVESHNT